MSRPILILAALCGLAAAPAASLAADSPVSAAFGSTIVSTYPDGRTAELWLAPDGGYTARGRKGDPSSGHWTAEAGKLCLHQAKPLPFGSWCTPIPTGGLHKAWHAKAVTGEAITVRLEAGRHQGSAAPAQ